MAEAPAAAERSAWFEPVELAGPTLRLRPLGPGDAADFVAALGAPAAARAVTAHLSYDPPTTTDEAAKTIGSLTAYADRVVYAQRIARTSELVGVTSFYEIDPAVRSLAIGQTWVAQSHWRTGVNTESKLIMMTRAFEGLGAER
ncbi:MAG: GNAT family protein, partial [Propionibacteriaceae bacterium]